MSTRQLRGQAVHGLAFLLAVASPVMAGSFAVNPVRATLSADHPVAALAVRNDGDEPTVIQITAVLWSQTGDRDEQSPTTDILASPPIFTVRPGRTQTVRVGLRRAPDDQRELTYRLVLREVPREVGTGSTASGLRLSLVLSIPVFVNPSVATKPVVQWRALQKVDGQIEVEARNTGSAHVQIGAVGLTLAENGTTLGKQQSPQYVLPGNARLWVLKPVSPLAAGTALEVVAITDAGEMRSRVVLERGTAATTAPKQH